MRYLLNSPILSAFGEWDYSPIRTDDLGLWLGDWLGTSKWENGIGDPRITEALEQLANLPIFAIPVAWRTITMQPGDEALVFRLIKPLSSLFDMQHPPPFRSPQFNREFIAQHCEAGILTRLN